MVTPLEFSDLVMSYMHLLNSLSRMDFNVKNFLCIIGNEYFLEDIYIHAAATSSLDFPLNKFYVNTIYLLHILFASHIILLSFIPNSIQYYSIIDSIFFYFFFIY